MEKMMESETGQIEPDPQVPALEARGLTKSFDGRAVVDGIDLTVEPGEVLAVLGPNGAGKTTFVRMAATLLSPDAGSVRIFGHDVVAEPGEVRELIGLTGQATSIDEELTARQNLELFARLRGVDAQDAADRTAAQLSGGMRRRLDLAVGLVASPWLLFLDEPTTGLDPRTRTQMWNTMRDLVDEGTTLVITTQYLEEAEKLADRVAIIDHGRLVALGTPDELERRLGGQTLAFTVAGGADAERAARIAGDAGGTEAEADTGGRITLTVTESAGVQRALAALDAAGIEVEDLSVSQPNMDDVFLATTDANERERTDDATRKQPAGRPGRGPAGRTGTPNGRGPRGRSGSAPKR